MVKIQVCFCFCFIFSCIYRRLNVGCFVANLLRRIVKIGLFVSFCIDNSHDKVRFEKVIISNFIHRYSICEILNIVLSFKVLSVFYYVFLSIILLT